jgi:aminobenzoyl-glutamate utilization protein B
MGQVMKANLERLNDLQYDESELPVVTRIQQSLTNPPPLTEIRQSFSSSSSRPGGSTDVGDVSWIVPTTGLSTACWVPGTSAHSWQAVAAGNTSIGKKGMMLAAKVLAATARDLMRNQELIAQAQTEFRRRTEGVPYRAMLEPDQKAPLDYRNPARRTVGE